MSASRNASVLLASRIGLGLLFVLAGVNKISGYEGVAGYMSSVGVPGILLPGVIALEVVGGLAIIAGFKTRLAAYALAAFSVLAGVLFHFDLGNQSETTALLKNLAIAGGFLALAVAGPGRFSVDGE